MRTGHPGHAEDQGSAFKEEMPQIFVKALRRVVEEVPTEGSICRKMTQMFRWGLRPSGLPGIPFPS